MKNIYIIAMEFGFNNPNGLKYSWLRKEVERKLGEAIAPDAEYAFIDWISESFSCTDFNDLQLEKKLEWIKHHLVLSSGNVERFDKSYKEFNKAVWVMKGSTTKQYLDYLELKETRKNAKQASGLSIFSIFVAVAAILIGAFQNVGTPKPPFEVKVIEDKTRTDPLEKKIDQLEERLYEAETLIAVYKSDTLR